MKQKDIDLINDLRLKGYGPTRIAQESGIAFGTVASYSRRHPAPPGMYVCKECGVFIPATAGRKARKFCCNACKTAWWNKHRTEGRKNVITVKCAYCGKEIQAYESDKRKYCSRECYHKARRANR